MAMSIIYANIELSRAEIEALPGPAVIEFGASWCGHCQAAQPLLAAAFAAYPLIPHIKIEDGKEPPLGRIFQVKLWPTLIFLNNGKEVVRLVHPMNSTVITEAFAQIE